MLRKIIPTLILSIFLFIACRASKPVPEQNQINKSEPPKNESINNNKQPPKDSNSQGEIQKQIPKKETESKILSSFNTEILDSDPDRINNMRLASKKINGIILKPGEVFSFNEIVGKRDVKKGYKNAKVLINGEATEDVGGGICQVSSTVYNSASKLGMEIIERHDHSKDVGYIQKGRDAAVSYGGKDLKFRNNKNYSVKVAVSIRNGRVYVSLSKV